MCSSDLAPMVSTSIGPGWSIRVSMAAELAGVPIRAGVVGCVVALK